MGGGSGGVVFLYPVSIIPGVIGDLARTGSSKVYGARLTNVIPVDSEVNSNGGCNGYGLGNV